MTETKKCIYCNTEKDIAEFSLEHIFPDSLGGTQFSELFKTRDVCQRCNSISGLFIDGPFIKNFFCQNDKSEAALRFIDLNRPASLPMKYMGVLKNIKFSKTVECECWMGAHGGFVYHVRRKADKRWDCMIGGNPIENKKDNGTVFIYAQNGDNYWLAVLLLSCLETFKGARFISGNIDLLPPPEGQQPYFDVADAKDDIVLKQISGLQGRRHECHFAIQEGFEQRFTAKVALGLAKNLFGHRFLDSEYAEYLRNALWEKDVKKRQKCGVQFYKYFSEENHLAELFALDGAHTILFYPSQDMLFLIMFIYGKKMIMIPICKDKELWRTKTEHGFLFIVAPQVQTFIGPIEFHDFIAYKGDIVELPELDTLLKRTFDVSTLPKITDEG